MNALRIEQNPEVPLFVFGVDGRRIPHFAAVQLAVRDASGALSGYQRARVSQHIREIAEYLASEGAILPNAIVMALDESVSFEALSGAMPAEWGTFGVLTIPEPALGQKKPGLIVDGQQRVAALSTLDPQRMFPVVVVALCSSSERVQREQFVLVNKTKPLPRDLLNELLPKVDVHIPRSWGIRRRAAGVLEKLRFDPESPFCERIRGIGSNKEWSNISQASLLGVIQNSMNRGGVLAQFREGELTDHDLCDAAKTVSVFFAGVRRVWPSAWAANPRSSRLVHGVGIAAIGSLMDVLMHEIDPADSKAVDQVAERLRCLEGCCAWSGGRWPGLGVRWDDLQNTSQDKKRLASYLLRQYQRAKQQLV